ncbi:hypothetical protein PV328_009633 [Microctonus aethiopoides]|uniref:Odorant receptor n=1 Tax=Microctonus aethiopoides TaxID=144406 RepID=A0AA39EWF2_9HYME|nr:hypothetical protein PV328_009633 [Microctonus aethiopoides]
MNVTLVLRAIIFCAKITSTWPSNFDSNFSVRIFKNFQWFVSLLNAIGLFIPLLLGAYHYRNESVKLMKVLSETTALTIILFNFILCKWQEKNLRVLLAEVISFVKTVKGDNEIILHNWVNRYLSMWIFGVVLFAQAAIFFSFGPFVTSDLLPATSWYPFEIKPFRKRHYFIFIQQVIAIFQTGLGITTDITISFLLCYLSAKLEILDVQIKSSRELEELNYCINEHENCIRFFKLLTHTARFMLLKSNLLMAMTIIFGAIPLISREPLTESLQFILIVTTSYLRIYMMAWPADDVREMSQKIAWSIYDSSWVGSSTKIQKSVAFVICRAHKPFIISIPGLLPPLTLQFYSSFVSATLSYFATLRAVLGK